MQPHAFRRQGSPRGTTIILILLAAGLTTACNDGSGGGHKNKPMFVAIGDDTVSSRDGEAWKDFKGLPLTDYWSVASGGGLFLAGDESGRVWYSKNPPGDPFWTESRVAGQTEVVRGLAYSAATKTFVAAVTTGSGGRMYYSTDLPTWTPAGGNDYGFIKAVASNGDGFVAVGNYLLYGAAWSSPTGDFWTRQVWGILESPVDVTSGDGEWVAVGYDDGSFTSWRRPDWRTRWDSDSMGSDFAALRVEGVAFGNGRYVAVGSTPGFSGYLWESDNGSNWNGKFAGGTRLRDVTHGNGQFVAVGENAHVIYSDDGLSWRQATVTGWVGGWLRSVAYRP